MSVPLLSVVVPTNRVGGMDALFAGLREQEFLDFELILVDELGDRRSLPPVSYSVTHLGPESGPRWGNYMRSLNRALDAASGERLVFWPDYACPSPGTLALHAAYHAADPSGVYVGDIDYVAMPPVHPEFPARYGYLSMGHDQASGDQTTYAPYLDSTYRHVLYDQWRAAYEADLAAGSLDRFAWSSFAVPVSDYAQVAVLPLLPAGRQTRTASPHLNLKNDSISRSLLLSNRFDERADGCHGHQDSMTAKRLGAELRPIPGAPVRILDPHNLMIIRRMERPDTDNLRLYQEAC